MDPCQRIIGWHDSATLVPGEAYDSLLLTEASEVFLLGCTFVELLTGCTRWAYDWLIDEAPVSLAVLAGRHQESTGSGNVLEVPVWS